MFPLVWNCTPVLLLTYQPVGNFQGLLSSIGHLDSAVLWVGLDLAWWLKFFSSCLAAMLRERHQVGLGPNFCAC